MPYQLMRDGTRVYVRVLGRGEPVVLLHGFAMDSRYWLPFVAPYLKRYRFILPDLRGFGRSKANGIEPDDVLAQYAQDLEDILEDFLRPYETFRLGGVSMGALTSMQYMRQTHFRRVRAYMHLDQSPKCVNDESWQYGLFGAEQGPRFVRYRDFLNEAKDIPRDIDMNDIPEHLKKELWRAFGEFAASSVIYKPQKVAARQLLGREFFGQFILSRENWGVYIDCMRAYVEQDYDYREDFKSFEVPLTVMVGMLSDMYPSQGQLEIARYHSATHLVKYHRGGHAFLFDQPVKFTKELGAFLAR